MIKTEAEGEDKGWVKVRWPNGDTNCYRDQPGQKQDLKPATAEQRPRRRISVENAGRTDAMRLRR